MKRQEMIARLSEAPFDVIVVGGGATGLGVAVDAASRGDRALLLEAHDFAKGTSSRSTKLVHGGVRYLEQLNFSLVMEALRERGLLVQNAPHLVSHQAFVVPRYKWWEGPFYGVGLKLYDALARELNLAPSRFLDFDETLRAIPNVQHESLLGGVMYHDAQFDDARMAISLALTAADHGAVLVNAMQVEELIKKEGLICGVVALDRETGTRYSISGRVVVNATGIFSDGLRRLDQPNALPMTSPSQGVHLVLGRSFAPSENAIMVPNTDDGRVLFVIPWYDRVLVGTTDTPMAEAALEPRALPEEIEFILRNAAGYMARDPSPADVLSIFAGQRPLVRSEGDSKRISREHLVVVSDSGLVTIIGGKWTTYRKMAEDAMIDTAQVGGFWPRPCLTERLPLHGWMSRDDPAFPEDETMRVYGADAAAVEALAEEDSAWAERLHPRLPYRGVQVVWAARCEMARTLEDVLARRTRSLFLDARASIEMAPRTAHLLATELGRDEAWEREQVRAYCALARGYLLEAPGDVAPPRTDGADAAPPSG